MDIKNKTSSDNIQKLDFDTIKREQIPFVAISTHVIQNIKNHFAGFIWVFLQSLPPDWKVNKAHIMNHFSISERTYQRHMSFLSFSNLVRYERDRLENGTLGPVTLKVLNGLQFNDNADSNHTAKIGIVEFNHTAKKPHSGETTPVANGTLTNTINNTKTKQEINMCIYEEKYTPTSMNQFRTAMPKPANETQQRREEEHTHKSLFNYQEVKNQFVSQMELTQKINKLKSDCIRDVKSQELFRIKLGSYDVEFIDVLDSCIEYYGVMEPPQFVSPQRFQKWLRTTDPEKNGYQTRKQAKENLRKTEFTPEEQELMQDLKWQNKNSDKPAILFGGKLEKARKLLEFAEALKNV